ncbi:MAG TPA: MBOAT family protein [Acetobacteraceae bacterium]|jgi:alginate O-acetyltransferase complex protein AlgI|nr:MBOAT family protein [Acetobacteraceae bacterium]
MPVSFSGFPFLLGFLPVVLAGFALFSRFGPVWAKSWLIAASLAFYAVGAPTFLPLLILSVAGNFFLLHIVHGSSSARGWTMVGLALNLAALGWFKYLQPHAPLGLSFFTFTQIGCLLYHADGETKPPRALDYALFAAFFPALLAGPILNPGEMLPQFARANGWRLNVDTLSVGSGFFVIGLLKKTLLADPLSVVVAAGFGDPAHLALFPAWQAAASYSLMLYFDFSGYTDMAIGLAWMVGLRFPDNFDQPYRASSVIGYWQRWHMSLTRFLVSNVHAPLTLAILRWRRTWGLSIDAAAQRTPNGFTGMIALPIIVTMVLVGLWHGATWPFVVFALLHSGFLLINHAWRLVRAPALPNIAAVALTYVCVLTAGVIFRSDTLANAGAMLSAMAGFHGPGSLRPDIHGAADIAWLVSLYGLVWFAPSTRQFMLAGPSARFAWRPTPAHALAMGCAATLGLLGAGGTGEFLYFRF